MLKKEYDFKMSDDDDDCFNDIDDCFSIEENIKEIKEIYVNIDNYIEEAFKYRKLFKLLRESTIDDIIHFNINSGGGNVDTLVQLINGMVNCKSKIICHVFYAASAGSCIALCGDEIIPELFSSMMLHTTSWGTSGKIKEMKAQTDFINKQDENMSDIIYKDFLTPNELISMAHGIDFWFTEDEIKERLKNFIPLKKRLKG
jgi:ATP-dependent protease ClpP protease subunit